MHRLFLLALIAFALPASAQPGSPAAGESRPVAGQGWWAFAPEPDRFDPASRLDLRSLNEDVAGVHGFVRLSVDGESFVRGDGEPIRFWGGTVDATGSHAAIDEQAHFLAKRGVNMARWHGDLVPTDRPDSQLDDVNEKALDQVFYLVAAMKKQGIYVTVSPYWAFAESVLDDRGQRKFHNWPLPRDPRARNQAALLFFDRDMQAAYKSWGKALLTRVNPYTGIALKDDPAVAIFQIQNEDSLLFWTLNGLSGDDRAELERQFAGWLVSRGRPGDATLPNLYELTQEPAPGAAGQRQADATEFLTETMRKFNAMMSAYVKDELGAKVLVNAGNWRTASMTRLNDAERYSYTPTDVLAVNRYVTGRHEGSDTTNWAVTRGEHFTNVSTLTDPGSFPLNIKQTAGHPMLVTESLWVAPNAFESEGPFMISAMQSLNGVDGFYWFSLGGIGQWDQPRSANGYMPSVGKFIANTPMTLGQFPAAALSYRMGYVRAADAPVVFEHRTKDDLWQRREPLIEEEGGFDPNRDTAAYTPSAGGAVSPLAYLAGPVKVEIDSGKDSVVSPFAVDGSTVTSVTGEMTWNFGRGVATLDTPKAQGVAGFLKAGGGEWRLRDTRIASGNDYAAITVVSLDGLDIAVSRKLLIQVGTRARPTGWVDAPSNWTDADGKTVTGRDIVEHGHGPWLITDSDATVEIANSLLTKATALDANGMAIGAAVVNREDNGLNVVLPKNCLYVIVEP